MDTLFMSAILLSMVVLLMTQVVRVEVAALLSVVALAMTGILTPAEALSGFSNPATITVGAMFILSAGLVKTGIVDYLDSALTSLAAGRKARLLLLLGAIAVGFSAFVNNTPIVIMMVPAVLSLSKDVGSVPSKYLIPLSYFSILGGSCTLLGTSTNILVDSIYREAGGPGFGLFEFSRLGVIFVVVGGTYLLLFSDRLLPERYSLSDLLSPVHRSSFVTEIRFSQSSRLLGRQFSEIFESSSIRVLQLVRGEEVIFTPPPETRVEAGDSMLVEATAANLHELISRRGVEHGSAVADHERVSISQVDMMVAEVVITPNSTYREHRLSEIGLNRNYGIKVLGMRRMGRQHQTQLRNMVLQTGDVLLVHGEEQALRRLHESQNVLLIEGVGHTLRFLNKAPIALGIMALVVGLAAFGIGQISVLALTGVVLMIVTRCLSTVEASRALNSSVLLLLAGTIPLGMAMAKTGIAENLAHRAMELAGHLGPIAILSCLYLITNVMTELLSNNATAVLLAPIGMEIAAKVGADPKPFLIAIAFAASASFSTPIGYQTNLIVMGPGGYRFRDYLRIGLPLNILLWAVATVAIPWLWPLN